MILNLIFCLTHYLAYFFFGIIASICNAYYLTEIAITSPLKLICTLLVITPYVCTFILGIILTIKYKDNFNLVPISLILAFGSQIMMIVSPVYWFRNNLCAILMIIFITATFANHILLEKKINKLIFTILAVTLFILSISNILEIKKGYENSKTISEKNIELIYEYHNCKKDNLTLYKYENDDFGWSMPYYSEYHSSLYKNFYNINCEINWITP